LNKLVELMCANPAKIFGMYPQKGTIARGSDADIVIFDPACEWTIKYENLSTRCGWTPYEGLKIRGKVLTTVLRGKIIYDKGTYLSECGYGKFIKRNGGNKLC